MTEDEYENIQTLTILRSCKASLRECVGDVEDIEKLVRLKIRDSENRIVIDEGEDERAD